MEFTCSYCGKSILCSGVVVDKRYFVHSKCEVEFVKTFNSVDNLINQTEEFLNKK